MESLTGGVPLDKLLLAVLPLVRFTPRVMILGDEEPSRDPRGPVPDKLRNDPLGLAPGEGYDPVGEVKGELKLTPLDAENFLVFFTLSDGGGDVSIVRLLFRVKLSLLASFSLSDEVGDAEPVLLVTGGASSYR